MIILKQGNKMVIPTNKIQIKIYLGLPPTTQVNVSSDYLLMDALLYSDITHFTAKYLLRTLLAAA